MKFDQFLICALTGFGLTIGTTNDVHGQEVCAPVLTLPGTIHTPTYDPFATSPLIEDVVIGYRDANCAQTVTLNASIGWGTQTPRLTNNGRDIGFIVSIAGVDLTSGFNPYGDGATPSNSVSITVPTGISGTVQQQARLVIPEGQVVPPGLYSLAIPGSAQGRTGLLSQTAGTSDIRATNMTISTQVLAVMKLGVTGCDLSADAANQNTNTAAIDLVSACTLNLGDPTIGMVNGDSRFARINAQANVNFKVSMMSKNGGSMRLSGARDTVRDTEKVTYTATLEGQGQRSIFTCSAVNCGSSELIEPSNSPLGSDLYFQVRIDDPDINQKRAGLYTDTITLVIQPAS